MILLHDHSKEQAKVYHKFVNSLHFGIFFLEIIMICPNPLYDDLHLIYNIQLVRVVYHRTIFGRLIMPESCVGGASKAAK